MFNTYCNLDYIHRWLSKWGMELASKKRMREMQWTPDDIEGELMPFAFAVKETEQIRTALCMYTPVSRENRDPQIWGPPVPKST